MKQTLVLCSSNRGVFEPTRKLINALKDKGALYVQQSGASCVALARNIALTTACELFDEHPDGRTLVMLDDDMQASVDDVDQLVAMSRKLNCPCSATYTTNDGSLAHAKMKDGPLWLSGLGLVAIPRRMILEIRNDSPEFPNGKRRVRAFTEAKMIGADWSSEDHTLSRRLGGVALLPLGVGHLKIQALMPNELQLDAVAHRFTEFCNGKL